ncbi:MAG: glycosyltransferase family 4 protein [candidate division Zixibacteria bacterium]|nr:glycosyltransferase family 4 protein [candidate division Zixibacteria bacterium]
MNIVVITHNYIRRRGDLTALYLHRLSAGLVDRGLTVTVVCPHAPGLAREETIDGVNIIRFPYLFSQKAPIVYGGSMHQEVAGSWWTKIVFGNFLWSFYREADKVCRRLNADLLWANWWVPPGLVAARIAARRKIPLVVSSHGTDIALLEKKGIMNILSRYVYRRARCATVVSTFLKGRLLRHVKVISEDRVQVIPMPVGMETFPKTDPPQNETPILLSVARFTRQKRLDDVIMAAAKLARTGVSFRVIMVGEGPLEVELKELVERQDLADRFEFVPLVAQQRLGELYSQSDIVVLSSEGEGFGLVLVEAGLTGRPVIGARSGGIVDIVEDGVNGLLYDPGDIDALAGCMEKLFSDRHLRSAMGEAGHERAMAHFSTPVLIDRVYDLFASLMPKQESVPR